MEIFGKTADEIWQKAYSKLGDTPSGQLQPSRVGDTSELLHVQFHIENPRERWILSRVPSINPAFALVEVIWIMSGRDNADYLNYWNRQLPKYAGHNECYHGAYGNRLRKKLGFDQLERAYHVLNNNPDSRQVVLQIWDSQMDLPDNMGIPTAPDIPCNTHAYLIIRNGKLEWTQFMRSNDIILGLPYNIVQFTSLQEIMAGWLNVPTGGYHHYSNSLHLYEVNRSRFNCSHTANIPANTDTLSLPKSTSDSVFQKLDEFVQEIVFTNLDETALRSIVMDIELPQAYKNWLYIIGAEDARRKSWHTTMQHFVGNITNPLLSYAWNTWYERFTNEEQATYKR